MRRSQHTDEEIAVLLAEADKGVPVETICADAGVSLRTFYRWRQRLGSLTPPAIRRLQELESENRRLRAMLMRHADTVPWPAGPWPASEPAPAAATAVVVRTRSAPGSRTAAGYRNCRQG